MVLVLATTMFAGLTTTMAMAQDGDVPTTVEAEPPAWLFTAEMPDYPSSQYATVLKPSDVVPCPLEPIGSCWTATAERTVIVDGEEEVVNAQFPFYNATGCRIDGYYYDEKIGMVTGIPAGRLVWTEGFSARECATGTATISVTAVAVSHQFTGVVSTVPGKLANVRSTTELTTTNIITQLARGAVVHVMEYEGDWYIIDNPVKGYIHNTLVDSASSSLERPSTARTSGIADIHKV